MKTIERIVHETIVDVGQLDGLAASGIKNDVSVYNYVFKDDAFHRGLAVFCIFLELEDKFNVELTDEEIDAAVTVQSIIDLFTQKKEK